MAATPLPERKSWQALKRHHQEIAAGTCVTYSPASRAGANG